MKTMKLVYVLSGLLLCSLITISSPVMAQSTATATGPTAKYSEEQKVEHLIQFISKMRDATFVRNGREHNCSEAAEHLESKWEKHKNDIKTAEGFVIELASKSGMTGEPYKIRYTNGSEKNTNEVLLQELQRLEQDQ